MRTAVVTACILALAGCAREQRNLRPEPANAGLFQNIASEGNLVPGGSAPLTQPPNPDRGNANDVSEGQRLYNWYNCSGCHFQGGGGIGPPLIKQEWIYGVEPANLFDTIERGRPNGMPTWGGRIPAYQIWQIVTYIRSMNHLEPVSATPPRTDSLESEPTVAGKQAGAPK